LDLVIVSQTPIVKKEQPGQGDQSTNSATEAADQAKQKRTIEKKLRQISELKDKQKSGAQLNEDQLEKLRKENDLIEQLNKLSFTG
jgi:uncharacterized protein with WD repeat